MSYVWENSPSKGGRLLLLLALADHANEDWIAWPKMPKLARKSRLSERQAERVVRELEADGEIEAPPKLSRPSKSYPYRIRQNVGKDENPVTDDDDSRHGRRKDSSPVTAPSREPSVKSSKGIPSQREGEISEVWQTYLEATGKTGMTLNDKRRRHINNALDVAIADTQELRLAKVKRAVVGLSLSPHHNGENDQRTPYLDIRYALKGIRDESDDERIDRMARIADTRGSTSSGAGIDQARIDRRLEEVRANRSSGGGFEPARAAKAQEELEGWGFRVRLLEAPPWAQLEAAA
jgi:hypothetical protein